ncbi:MAG: aldehyde ferredoxin oxidoreductase family protein [Proteobacteria bacterium]|nr:aldehyde ferredoxin oxidoreductase family protein [Desulfobacula sp.]MBU3954459.1 aldehyde ferredoxin oxidoreductase family protein [Pseudomonadota bacterium]MBU4133237.1 aldehyde ferredoxin oxidoreductase family protein [Pseudomonadota bacterium]
MSTKNKGYMGKIMNVDLSTGKIQIETISPVVYESFLSGMGLAAHQLYHRIPAGADPLGPDNLLGFVSGLLTGTGSLFTGRWMVVGKSPLTNGWGEANCGGNFSPAIKHCGVDGIFFTGASATPVYLYVDDTTMELRDATDLWGMDAVETETHLLKNLGNKKGRVACIGQSGENRSLISGISTDKGRMAARSGLGAVMGSKKLKALVLAGTRRIFSHNKEEIKRLSRICNRWVQFQPPFVPGFLTAPIGALMRIMPAVLTQDGLLYKILLRKWGTVSMNQMSVEMGDSPIKNWNGSSADWGFFKSRSSNPDVFIRRETEKFHCYSCPLGCGGICKTQGKFSETHKPEYETVLSLGGFVMNKDMDSIFYLNELLNRAGMDSISAGHTVAFALECFERGIITTKDTMGVELKWGDPGAIEFLIEKMITRDGIGDILADGVKKAAERIGNGADKIAIHAGGQEPAMHDSRNDPGFALHYSVDPAPGRHTNGAGLYYEMYQLWKQVKGVPKMGLGYLKSSKYKKDIKHARIGKANSQYMNVMNGAGACLFGGFLGIRRTPIFDWLNAATGWQFTPEQYMEIGTNIQTLKQAFNVRQGLNPKDSRVKDRLLGLPPQTKGANKGRTVDIDSLMKDYWELFEWDRETGIPSQVHIDKLASIA